MEPKHGHFGKYIRNTWKVLKCSAGRMEKIKGPIVWEEKYQVHRF